VKLNWFSPLPPQRSGIADYAAIVLPMLAARARIRVWTDQVGWDTSVERAAEVRHYRADAMPWREVNQADVTIYHLGNHAGFHGVIWQVSRRCPGVVILHDLRFHDLFDTLYRQAGDRAGYVGLMGDRYGAAGAADAATAWDGWRSIDYLAARYPLTTLAAEHALGVLVHNPRSVETLKREMPCPVAYSPLPYPRAGSAGVRAGGSTRVPEGPPFHIVALGHFGRNRRLTSLIDALSMLGEPGRFRLDVYGPTDEAGDLPRHVRSLGLEAVVRLHGFVPDAELEAALASAHLAANLRYPTMGEASLSQLRLWSHGLPTLVSRTGWYATLPPETVAFVRPEHEAADVQRHLRDFLADPDRFHEMGARARRLLEGQHAPDAYAAALMTFAREADRLRPQTAAARLVDRARRQFQAVLGPSADLASPAAQTPNESLLAEVAEAIGRERRAPRQEAAEVLRLVEAAGRLVGGAPPPRPGTPDDGRSRGGDRRR
jgi:glycosyltransferase involved in cell wall biosynthesis